DYSGLHSSVLSSTGRARFHSKCKVVTVEVDHVEVAHPIIVGPRRLDNLCSALGKFRVNTVDILHEHTDVCAIVPQRGTAAKISKCKNLWGECRVDTRAEGIVELPDLHRRNRRAMAGFSAARCPRSDRLDLCSQRLA